MLRIVVVLLLAVNIGLFFLLQEQAGQERANQVVIGGNLKLLSELAQEQKLAAPEATPAQSNAEEPAPANAVPAEAPPKAAQPETPERRYCYSYGPMATRLAAVGVLARLKERVRNPEIRQTANQTDKSYWVLLPTSDANQREIAEKLVAAGIQDIHHLIQGEGKGNLLLGIYRTRQQAEQRIKGLPRQAPVAEIKEHGVEGASHWIDFVTVAPAFDLTSLELTSKTTVLLRRQRCKP
jgi:hypothetical protein